jgi:HTH-type transcriptional regulator, cell division transcriptional repressor
MNDGNDWFSEQNATFGDRLAGARETAGMKQTELAKRLGVKVKTLRAWEEDLSEPRANRLTMLSGILSVSMRWLMTGQGDGLDGPFEPTEIPANLAEVLTEMRQMRTEMEQGAARLGRLEKRLRASLQAEL